MGDVLDPELLARLQRIASSTEDLSLLALHGSRATGTSHAMSDWDLAFQADGGVDADGLMARLVESLRADRVDLVDLDRAGALLRYRVARDGVLLFERRAGTWDRFRLAAVRTWCDLAPVLEPAYEGILESLRR